MQKKSLHLPKITTTMDKTIDLTVSNLAATRGRNYDIVILPWGATEPHNLHLPYMTDSILSHDIAVDAATIARDQYAISPMVMPPVNYGSQNPGQRQQPFCIHTSYNTQRAILTDTAASLYEQGIRRILIINGHGGNNFRNMIRDLAVTYPDLLIATCEWFKAAPHADIFTNPGDHADEVETSVMMHYHPDLVDLTQAGPGDAPGFRAPTLRQGIVWTPRNWNLAAAPDTGVGNPAAATPLKGQRFAAACAANIALAIRDLCDPRGIYYQ